jgi:hypothetical protein
MTHIDRCRQERHCATPDRVASGKSRACTRASTPGGHDQQPAREHSDVPAAADPRSLVVGDRVRDDHSSERNAMGPRERRCEVRAAHAGVKEGAHPAECGRGAERKSPDRQGPSWTTPFGGSEGYTAVPELESEMRCPPAGLQAPCGSSYSAAERAPRVGRETECRPFPASGQSSGHAETADRDTRARHPDWGHARDDGAAVAGQ